MAVPKFQSLMMPMRTGTKRRVRFFLGVLCFGVVGGAVFHQNCQRLGLPIFPFAFWHAIPPLRLICMEVRVQSKNRIALEEHFPTPKPV